MILSPHLITGAALSANFHNPYLMPISAIVLHHVLDKIPHYDYQIKPFSSRVASKVFLDILIGTITILIIYSFINPNISLTYTAMGMFFGILPDGLLLASFIFDNKWLQKYQKFHNFFHYHGKNQNEKTDKNLAHQKLFKKRFSWMGVFVQLIVIIIAIYFMI